MSFQDLRSSLPKLGSSHGRFTLISIDELEEYKSYGLLYEEQYSGCQIYHVWNEDEENLFSFNFKTIPESSNGVAHILEHTVLCGSQNYPVKDPFVMLYKGSMQTFLNAMTYPDKTIYPASSTVKQDVFNLMSVYADAVFFPLLKDEHFRQEGHRLEVNEDGEVEISGVVYNEMKANYSTHDSIAGDWTYRSVFPDTPYAYDSGGDPREIPNLKYSQFLDFHKTYYHPSNCLVFFYGNIPTTEYLDFLEDQVFSRFTPDDLSRRSSFEIPLQPKWSQPRDLEVSYPAQEGSDDGSSVNLTWMTGHSSDVKTSLALELLSDVLMGNPASPIQKLINESDLGEDLSSTSGYENELRQGIFSIGMRGTKTDRAQAVEELIMNGLAQVVQQGINPDLLEGSLRRFEFRSREIKGGGPFGLRLLGRSLRSWLHGERPRHSMDFAPVFSELRAELSTNPRYLETLIQRVLIDNPHRSRVTVYPDFQQVSREEALEAQSVQAKLAGLGDKGPDQVRLWSQRFAEFQAQADAPEDVAKLPFLSVDDIPGDIRVIPNSRDDLADKTQYYYHRVFTNGISYMDMGFDISSLTPAQQLFIPLLTQVLPQLGSADLSYEDMMLQWGLKSGGFSLYGENSKTVDGHSLQYCYVRLKALDSMTGPALDLCTQILTRPDFHRLDYLWELFSEYRNDLRSGIVPSGTNYAATRASMFLDDRAHIDDIWRGVAQLRFIEDLYQRAQNDRDGVLQFLSQALEEVASAIFKPEGLILNVTAEEDQLPVLRGQLTQLVKALREASVSDSGGANSSPVVHQDFLSETLAFIDAGSSEKEGLAHSSMVNFTAMALKASHLTQKQQVEEGVLAHILRTGLLWEKIRMEGGAYGAFASPDGLSSTFVFGSYRDPAIEKTWAAFKESLRIIAENGIDQRTLDLAKIAIAGKELKPLSPAEQGLISFKRVKYGIDDELRSTRRAWLIACSPEQIQTAAARLLDASSRASYAVLADPAAIDQLKQTQGELQRIDIK